LKAITRIMLVLFLTLTLSIVLVTPAAAAYPFEDIFKKDLIDIANTTPKIESIYIKSWLDFRPSGHLWAFIRINYTAGLSDYEKIDLQDYVQRQLESKWYIAIVERNYYVAICIWPTPPVPWPGFAIGDLNVAFKTAIVATVDVNPSTLNLNSEGEWITTYIELPKGYNVNDVDVSSLKLNNAVSVDLNTPTYIGDYGSDGVADLIVKFNRTELTSHIYKVLGIKYGNVTLMITGQLVDGTLFEGSDTIKVLFGGDMDLDGYVGPIDLSIFAAAYGKHNQDSLYNPYADLDYDKYVGPLDLSIFAANYGKHI